jgi:hypothetical protein
MSLDNNSIGKLSVGPSLVTDGLILYLDAASKRSYDGGATWKDLSGNDNDFTVYGSPNHNGQYFTLDGSTSQYVQANPFPHPAEDFTIELYERIDIFDNTPLYSYAVIGDSNEGLLYLIPFGRGIIKVYGPSSSESTGYELTTDAFHQIVRTRSKSDGEEKIYINGTLVSTITKDVGVSTITNGSFNVGQEQDSPGGGFHSDQTLNGDISIIKVYDRVLSAQEVHTNYKDIKVRYND